MPSITLQNLFRTLDDFWASHGCAILQPYDNEMGAGTMHPATALGALGPEPRRMAYVQPSRRPADGRYTRNPMRSQRYYQYQVLLKPNPDNIVDIYIDSLKAIGFDPAKHDVRFVEDDWESPSLGASGVGWEVWIDGTEITQFTFFQQMGGIECHPVAAEITYGPERICLMLEGLDSFWEELMWNENSTYKQWEYELELQHNVYNFEVASTEMLFQAFEMYEAESKRVIETPVQWDFDQSILITGSADEDREELPPVSEALVYPAFDLALKCSHIFNLLDARGVISVSERASYIGRIRALVHTCCKKHVAKYKKPKATA